MKEALNAIDTAISDTDRLRRILKRQKAPQVRSIEERSHIKATALAWYNNHRTKVVPFVNGDQLQVVDDLYKQLLSASDRASARLTYETSLKAIHRELSELRGSTVMSATITATKHTTDEPPEFSPLIADTRMQGILLNRWRECSSCISAGAPLAATVMMGGLLEALLLARVNKETDKTQIFKSASAPKDKKTGKAFPLQEWTLKNYIDVAHELKWISQSAKDIGQVLRDYRNYIHPYKELSNKVALEKNDAILFWEISKSISRQLIEQAKA